MSCSLLEGFYCGVKIAACQTGHSWHSRSVRIVTTEAGTIWFDEFFTRNRVLKEKKNEKGTLWWLLALELFVYKGTRFLHPPAWPMYRAFIAQCQTDQQCTSVTQQFLFPPCSRGQTCAANVKARNSTKCECKGVARSCVSVVRTLVRTQLASWHLLFLRSPRLSNELHCQCI